MGLFLLLLPLAARGRNPEAVDQKQENNASATKITFSSTQSKITFEVHMHGSLAARSIEGERAKRGEREKKRERKKEKKKCVG